MMSKAELARKAGVSVVTISKIENGAIVVRKPREKLYWLLVRISMTRIRLFPED